MRRFLALGTICVLSTPLWAQKVDRTPAIKAPDTALLQAIAEGREQLKAAVAGALTKDTEEARADLEIYLKAVEWIVRHQEWFTADSGKQALAVIAQGIKRAETVKQGKMPWLEAPGQAVARAYKSVVDGSVQPYGVIFPADYGQDKAKKWRLDVVLHGRDSSLTEVKFLNQHDGRPAPKGLDRVQINIYGRGNNAYRWAGEKDVDEVIDHFTTGQGHLFTPPAIDPRKIVLRGFSMGGAGAWHIGLRHPSRFAALQPGAGFTTTHGYIGKLPEVLPAHQEACLRIYDAYRYAENAFNVPIVAYSGDKDPQKKAADNIAAELTKLDLAAHMTHIVAPGLEHRFPPEWQAKAEVQIKERIGAAGRAEFAERIRFVTYSLKQSKCAWAQIRGMKRHYEPARIAGTWDGISYRVTTSNVTWLLLSKPADKPFPKSVEIDGKAVDSSKVERPGLFQWTADGWRASAEIVEPDMSKRPHLQGPIDDAFTGAFLCVVGTGSPWNSKMHKSALAQLERFRQEWDKYMRGTLVVKKDTEVTADDCKWNNLILFGDPGSNTLIAKVLPSLPMQWTADTVRFGADRFEAKTHLPMLIQPSPFSRLRYVVLNSGHTFHEADFKGTNALLYPRLGDFALVRPTPTDKVPADFDVVTAGLFDEQWQFPKR